MKIHFPTYQNNILNVINAIRKYEGLKTYMEIDEEIYQWLYENQFRQIQLVLVDGMGADLVERYAKKDGFLKRFKSREVETVYPPTTVAATTAIQCGLTPLETGWLGWQQYFEEIDHYLIPFLNKDYYTGEAIETSDYAYKKIPTVTIQAELASKGIKATEVYPAFRPDGCKSFEEMCVRLVELSKDPKLRYLYAYWDKFDSLMHNIGVNDPRTAEALHDIDFQLEKLEKGLAEDVAVIVIADHSQIDTKICYINDVPKLCEMFELKPTFEPRTINFKIKPECQDAFKKMFNEIYGESFVLYTREEVLKKNLFGPYKEGTTALRFIGDFVACAISDVALFYSEERDVDMIGNHAGMSEAEMMIPLICFSRKQDR